MAGPTNRGLDAFLPTSFIYDSSRIQYLEVNSPEFKNFLVTLTQTVVNMLEAINLRDAGYYVEQEFRPGQLYFNMPPNSTSGTAGPVFRTVFRKVVDFGALPNAATKSVAHGIPSIDNNFIFTRIYATATDPGTSFIPIPYASSTDADNIELEVDATNVNITTGVDRTGYTECYVVLEYLKNNN